MIFKERTVQETNRSADVNDRFGHTRFCVGLRKMDDLERENAGVDAQFEVRVVQIGGPSGNRTVVDKFFRYYDEAVDFYQRTLKEYELLVKAECRDEKDIHIYKDRIGYRKIKPDCCANCRWAQPKCKENSVFSDWKGAGCGSKYICMNADIFQVGKRRLDAPVIRPEVEGDCICDHHVRVLDPRFRNPAHSQWAFEHHDCLPENQQETIIRKEIEDQLNKKRIPPPDVIGGGDSTVDIDFPDVEPLEKPKKEPEEELPPDFQQFGA